ncbi:MAG: DNA polymerase IV [Candidatus Methanosuratincola sp.]|jgi:DNA polymerase IV (DinB-like DNA polymerase)
MRIIAHIDMDAFFAAVEERDKPWLRGLPIVVGANPEEGKGRGVVATASYLARAYGIHSGQPISRAWRLSEAARKKGKPPVVFLKPSFGEYEATSQRIMEILKKYSDRIEQASIDEAYIDLSHAGSFEEAERLARRIKDEIRERESLTATIGIGPNKMVAKIASGVKKPDGLTVVLPHEVVEFLDRLPVRSIPGIGPKTEEALKKMGIERVGDLRRRSKEELEKAFGRWGGEFYEKAWGRDESPVEEVWVVKSIGEQETFRVDTLNPDFLFKRLGSLCHSVFTRFVESGFKGFRTVVLTVRFADFETKSRSHTLPEPQSTEEQLRIRATRLLMPFLDRRENPRNKPIRLLGVRVERLL